MAASCPRGLSFFESEIEIDNFVLDKGHYLLYFLQEWYEAVWFVIEMVEQNHTNRKLPPPPPSPSFWSLLIPLVQISFSPQPSAAVKIKDGSYNFYQDSVKHSPAEITLALQASLGHPGKFSQHGQLDLHSIFCLVTDRELMFDLLYLQREVLQLWQQ